MDPIYELEADVLKTLANARRLEILHRLSEGGCEVGRLAAELGLSQPNVSQHLALLRNAGMVVAVREGREVRYELSDGDVMVACDLMRDVLRRRLSRLIAQSAPEPEVRAAARPAPAGAPPQVSVSPHSR